MVGSFYGGVRKIYFLTLQNKLTLLVTALSSDVYASEDFFCFAHPNAA